MTLQPPPRPDLGMPEAGAPARIEGQGRGLRGGPPATWTLWSGLGMFLAANVVLGSFLIGGVVLLAMGVDQPSSGGAGLPELIATLAAGVTTVAVFVAWLGVRHRGWIRILGLPAKGRWFREVVLAVALGPAVYLGVALLVALVLSVVIALLSGREVAAPEQIDAEGLSSAGRVVAVLVAVIVAPIVEELVFRGVLFRSVRDRWGFWAGALVSSALFGLVHWVNAPWQDALLLQCTMVFTGLALAAVYEWRGNLVSCIVTHMSFNVIGITLILGTQS